VGGSSGGIGGRGTGIIGPEPASLNVVGAVLEGVNVISLSPK